MTPREKTGSCPAFSAARLAGLAVCAAAMLAGGAAAEQRGPISVGQLAAKCKYAALSTSARAELPAGQLAEAEWCQAYIRGVHDMNSFIGGEGEDPPDGHPGYCFPDYTVKNITFMARAFVRWARKNPDAAGLPGAEGLVAAMRLPFPC